MVKKTEKKELREYRVFVTWKEIYAQTIFVKAHSKREAEQQVHKMWQDEEIDATEGYDGTDELDITATDHGTKQKYVCVFELKEPKEETVSVVVESFPNDLISAAWEELRETKFKEGFKDHEVRGQYLYGIPLEKMMDMKYEDRKRGIFQ